MRVLRVGTRGSKLALAQTGLIARQFEELHPGIGVEIVSIRTTGDMRVDVPFAEVGTKGMFVKEIEEALLVGAIDFAVHSLKDMPGELAGELALAASPPREDPRDALVSRTGELAQLHLGASVGTSSLRRKAQLMRVRPDLNVVELRGNLDTRLRKLDEAQYDAILLACAGLERLGLTHRIRERLPVEAFVPAPGQGILGLEIRANDSEMANLLSPLNDSVTEDSALAERAFQAALDVGCTFPVGGHAVVGGEEIRFIAMIGSPDNSDSAQIEMRASRAEAAEIGRAAARAILKTDVGRTLKVSP